VTPCHTRLAALHNHQQDQRERVGGLEVEALQQRAPPPRRAGGRPNQPGSRGGPARQEERLTLKPSRRDDHHHHPKHKANDSGNRQSSSRPAPRPSVRPYLTRCCHCQREIENEPSRALHCICMHAGGSTVQYTATTQAGWGTGVQPAGNWWAGSGRNRGTRAVPRTCISLPQRPTRGCDSPQSADIPPVPQPIRPWPAL
jgi:hypothetical protein